MTQMTIILILQWKSLYAITLSKSLHYPKLMKTNIILFEI
jgi:hypothetical protein